MIETSDFFQPGNFAPAADKVGFAPVHITTGSLRRQKSPSAVN